MNYYKSYNPSLMQAYQSICKYNNVSPFQLVQSRPHRSLFDFPDDAKFEKINDDDLFEMQCDPCLPGWGVKTLCNGTINTICSPCPLGTWSPRRPHFRPCSTCSKCGDALYEDLPCTSTRDTQCDSCSN